MKTTMKLRILIVILVTGMLLVPTLVLAGSDGKVSVCHIPPGNPDNASTILVSQHALETHLAHGDETGECGEEPETKITGTIYCTASGGIGWWSTNVDPTQVTIVMSGILPGNTPYTANLGVYASPGQTNFAPSPVGSSSNMLELWLDGVLLDSCERAF